jgi:hypothetical protein
MGRKPLPPEKLRSAWVGAMCTKSERVLILNKAHAAGLSISDYVRRALNGMWLEEGDEMEMLEEAGRKIYAVKGKHV